MTGTEDTGRDGTDPLVATVDRALAAALAVADAPNRSASSRRKHDRGAGIDTGASLLAANPAIDAELRRRGEGLVRLAWERGWQPADVVRLVRRDLDEPHQRLVAELIVAESRAYQWTAPRWTEQLAELAGPAAEPYRADRFSHATAVLELYRLLARLPAIEPVGPVPGTPVHVPRREDEPRSLGRIRALLAKAEATGYPPEAEALTAKAQELMARYSIDEAVLADAMRRGPAGSGSTPRTRPRRRSCSTRWRRPTAAARCGTALSASRPSSGSNRTWPPSNCSTPHCWCRRRRR
jgi:hypothetical protein